MAKIESIYHAKPSQAKQFVIRCIESGIVPFLQSSPGCGKSAIIKEIAQEQNLELIDLRLSMCEVTDLNGLPKFETENGIAIAKWVPFNAFPIEGAKLPPGKEGWLLFLDEFNSCRRDVAAASYKLVLDRMIGMNKLHPRCAIVCAGNLATDKAITNNIGSALQSRLAHIHMEVNFDDWCKNVAFKHKYDSRIIAFIHMFNSNLLKFDPNTKEASYPCPRTWEFVNRLLQDYVWNDKTKEYELQPVPITNEDSILFAGIIGAGTAVEFVRFCQIADKVPSFTAILSNPTEAEIPEDTSLRWATIVQCIEKTTTTNLTSVAKYIERFDTAFQVLYYRSLYIKDNAFIQHPTLTKQMGKVAKYLSS